MQEGVKGDIASGAVLVALGLFIISEAWQWDYLTPEGPGPGFFPLWYGIAMVLLAAALILTAVLSDRVSLPMNMEWPRVRRALATWAAFAIAIALLTVLGFVLSFAFFTFYLVRVLYGQSTKVAATVAVSCAAGFFVVFPLLLGVPLPTGAFGF
jgi:putative tricarboxylic transport membrane protein